MTEERAVLDAAENWLRAREAVLTEDESRQQARDAHGIPLTERACDQADFDLTIAVLEWRKAETRKQTTPPKRPTNAAT